MSVHAELEGVPWWPASMAAHEPAPTGPPTWSYVLVEETVGSVAELTCWSWPFADQHGRLRWPEDAGSPGMATVPTDLLRAVLYRPDLQRRPRAGDAFAVQTPARRWQAADGAPRLVTTEEALERLLPGRILDVSADARKAAKLSYLAAAAPVHRDAEIDDWEAQQLADQRQRQHPAPVLSSSSRAPEGPGHYQDLP